MVKQECGYLNACVYYSTSMTTIISTQGVHLIYLSPRLFSRTEIKRRDKRRCACCKFVQNRKKGNRKAPQKNKSLSYIKHFTCVCYFFVTSYKVVLQALVAAKTMSFTAGTAEISKFWAYGMGTSAPVTLSTGASK
jgi:hypothetical protein